MTAPVGLREQIAAAALDVFRRQTDEDSPRSVADLVADAVLSVVAGQVDVLAATLAEHDWKARRRVDGGGFLCTGCGHRSATFAEARTHVAKFLVSRMVGGER